MEARRSTTNHEREGCGHGPGLPELGLRARVILASEEIRAGRVDPRSGSEARRRLPESEPTFAKWRALVEKQDAAVPFRVRVDVASWGSCGDAAFVV